MSHSHQTVGKTGNQCGARRNVPTSPTKYFRLLSFPSQKTGAERSCCGIHTELPAMSFSKLAQYAILFYFTSVAAAIAHQNGRFLGSHRSVQEICHEHQSFQTPFNENELVPSYHGIIFDIAVLTDEIEVVSLEFDAKINQITDMQVEIFTMNGSEYQDIVGNETAWEKVADTKAIASADGQTLSIPESSFNPQRIKRGKRQSFYISMKGPWIDSVVDALDKTGEIQTRNKDMLMYVGVGLNSRFPEDGEFDKTVDPQFSGVIKYRKVIDCNDDFKTTSVALRLITPQSENPVFVAQLGSSMDDVVETTLLNAAPFKDMVSTSHLTVSRGSETSNYPDIFDCPEDWETCPRNVIISTLTFKHSKSLSSGKLQYEIYRFADSLMKQLAEASGARRMKYVGLRAITSEFDMTLGGLPTNQEMSKRHQGYLADTLTRFFGTSIGRRTDAVEVLETVILDIEDTTVLGTAKAAGIVLATQAAYLPTESLALELVDSIVDEHKVLLQDLRVGTAAHSEGYADTIEYFGKISTVTATFTVYIPAAGVLGESNMPFDLDKLNFKPAYILPFLFCCCCCGCSLRRKSKQKEQEIQFDGDVEKGGNHKGCASVNHHSISYIGHASFTSVGSEARMTPSGHLQHQGSSRSINGLPSHRSSSSMGDRSLGRIGSSNSLQNPHRQNTSQFVRKTTLTRQGSLNSLGDATKLQRQRSPDLRRQNSSCSLHNMNVSQNHNFSHSFQRQGSCRSVCDSGAQQKDSFRTGSEVTPARQGSANSLGDATTQRRGSFSNPSLQRQGSSSSMKNLRRYSSCSLHRQDLPKSLRTTSMQRQHSSRSMNEPTNREPSSLQISYSSLEQGTVIVMFD
eukprot:scaffold3421_cov181-Amphora_coffeaeformis.AAC.25